MYQQKVAVKESKWVFFFHRYGWLALFAIFCFFFYSHAMHKKSAACVSLKQKIQELEILKSRVEKERQHLAMQIQSQGDPEWIELVLKKRLGVVPEGQMKVYFKKDE